MKILYHCSSSLERIQQKLPANKAVISRLVDLTSQERLDCEKSYIEAVGSMARRSYRWWAHPFSEKNEHLSHVYQDLCQIYKIVKAIDSHLKTSETILIQCPSKLWPTLCHHYQAQGIKLKTFDSLACRTCGSLKEGLLASIKMALVCLNILKERIGIFFQYRNAFKKKISGLSNPYVMRTWLDGRYLTRTNEKDAYFGDLGEFLKNCGYAPVYIAGILNNHKAILKKIKSSNENIIPENYFLRIGDVLRAKLDWWKIYFEPISPAKVFFMGIDIRPYCISAIRSPLAASAFVMNVLKYHIAYRLGQEIKAQIYLLTFENYAWEKMTILGLTRSNQEAKIYGFQHAFISRNSFKYFSTTSEIERMPIPKKIICLGEVTHNILLKYGHYPPESLRVGCSLRQDYKSSHVVRSLTKKKVLVPLTMVTSETKKILEFIQKAQLQEFSLEIIIRPHPATEINRVIEKIGFQLNGNIKISRHKDLQEDLKEVDLVFYTWSTVAIEAVNSGIPAVYMDILEDMYVDPLFECFYLKKTVKTPYELKNAVQELYQMSPQDYQTQLQQAQTYLRGYFFEVCEKNLEAFII
jgi:hypothetical protein